MRNKTYALICTVTLLTGGAIGACSGDVTTNPSTGATGTTGGNGGSSSAATTSTSITAATTTSTTISASASVTGAGGMTSSSTTGGGTCNDACAHAASCGSDICKQFGADCTTIPMQAECPLACIAVAPCDEIQKLTMQQFNTPLGACIFGCQGGGGTGGATSVGSGPLPDAGGPPPNSACTQCTFQKCFSALGACATDMSQGGCGAWAQCVQGCQGATACVKDCDTQFPNAAPKYKPVYDCLCMNCNTDCGATIDPCNH